MTFIYAPQWGQRRGSISILAYNFSILERRAERKEINLLKNLLAILLIYIYNIVRYSKHISNKAIT